MAEFLGDRSPNWVGAGLSSVGAYQLSGIPFASSSISCAPSSSTPWRVAFPFVSKRVTVRNDSAAAVLRVGFSANGIKGIGTVNSTLPYVPTYGAPNYYFTLAAGESFTEEWRLDDLYLLSNDGTLYATASVIAALAPISRGVPPISGTITMNNWSGSIGVG